MGISEETPIFIAYDLYICPRDVRIIRVPVIISEQYENSIVISKLFGYNCEIDLV